MNIELFSPNNLYLIALSGGADSVALALMMKNEGLSITALHCNFHLRGDESDRDERFVRNFCQEQNIPLEVKHFDTLTLARQHGVSIEMEARELRYTWFAEMVKKLHAEAICVAHHQDDQAETLLLNLIRGTGLRGLSAMHPDRTINGLRILRPLLSYSKKYILDYLKDNGQEYVTDSTNLEREALRNCIRLDVIPMLQKLNPNISECLARTAENVRLELDKDSSEAYYHSWLSPNGFTRQQILDIHAHVQKEESNLVPAFTGKTWHSPTHILLLDRKQCILRELTSDNMPPTSTLCIKHMPCNFVPTRNDFHNKSQAFIDASQVKGTLILRPVAVGDRFRPFGMKNGTKLVSDFLTDRKVNLLDKQSQLVVIDTGNNNIVWICGREIDNRYSVTSQSTNILRITLTSADVR